MADARNWRRLAAVLLLACSTLTGCREAAAPAATTGPARGGELIASLRSEPGIYSRVFEASAAAELFSLLTQARLVRVNRTTDAVEPGLAERWQQSADGTTVTMELRKDAAFSDGMPFTSADVLFSFAAAYAPDSMIGEGLKVADRELEVTAQGPHAVTIKFAAPFAPGIRLLDNLPMLPRHKLEAAFKAGNVRTAWTAATPLSEVVGTGPFVLAEHAAGRRLVFNRNPRYWRRDANGVALPYLDRLIVEIIPETNAEALRLESGATDLMSNGDIRPDDFARFKRLADQGRLRLVDGGVGLDPNVLWFNLKPPAGRDPKPWIRRKEFRQALSLAADRKAIANTVYLGAAVPIFGPITPRNATWFVPPGPNDTFDTAKARRLLAAAGLTDRNGDGMLEDAGGAPVRFSTLVQQGHSTRERTVSLLQESFRRVGVAIDVVGLDAGGLGKRWMTGDYDSIFHGFQASATDPAMNLDFWLSSGANHVWNPNQPSPATEWERRVDDLMRRQSATTDLAERQRLFAEVQRIFGEELPALHFVAPNVTLALSPRVVNPNPAPQIPQLLWSADTLAAAGSSRAQ
jgi:peptide/nickel transport system substrate-binding protein